MMERPLEGTFTFIVDNPHLATVVIEVWSRGSESVRDWLLLSKISSLVVFDFRHLDDRGICV